MQRDDRDPHVITNGPDADRVAAYSRAFAAALLQFDTRVQAVHREWLERATREAERGAFTSEREALRSVFENFQHLIPLSDSLGLARFRWLPQLLLFEFIRSATGLTVERTPNVPPGASWFKRGRAPKRGDHNEDIERYVHWFYRTQVKDPKDTAYQIALEVEQERGISQAKSYVRDRIERVEWFLSALD